jgi:hypothetical protein
MKLRGPRLKILATRDRSSFTLVLDTLDKQRGESKIAVIEVQRAQLEEWTRSFTKVLAK